MIAEKANLPSKTCHLKTPLSHTTETMTHWRLRMRPEESQLSPPLPPESLLASCGQNSGAHNEKALPINNSLTNQVCIIHVHINCT